jgi:predicted nucleic acid-binding protein
MLKALIDSSIVLRYLLNGDESIFITHEMDWVGGSDLLFIECHRVLERVRIHNELSPDKVIEALDWLNLFFSGLDFIRIHNSIIRRAARPYPVLLKTLDAIHLASLEFLCGEENAKDWAMLTLDSSLGRAARSIGFSSPLVK